MATLIDKALLTSFQGVRDAARHDCGVKTVYRLHLLAAHIRTKQLSASEAAQLLDDEAEKMENEVRKHG